MTLFLIQRRVFGLVALVMAAAFPSSGQTPPAGSPAPVLWDTVAPLGDNTDPAGQSGWATVPNDLLLLEKDPPKASSDPGYYGREYSFRGDAVIETRNLLTVFRSAQGAVTLFARQESSTNDPTSKAAQWKKVGDLVPTFSGTGALAVSSYELLRNAGDVVVLQVAFSGPDSAKATALFAFDRTGIVEVRPGANMKDVRFSGPIQYGVVPAFIGDDLLFGGAEPPVTNTVAVPAENFFLGLLEGKTTELVMAWPKGRQRMTLQFAGTGSAEQGAGSDAGATIKAVDFHTDTQNFYLAALSAPGLWHKHSLTAEYLEKDAKANWKPPFPARWKTLLYEEELKTTFAFRPSKGQVWRGVAGSYQYPVWFEGEDAFFHFSKKIQPKGEAIIYCLEGRDTPSTIVTPADMLQQTLGRTAAAPILDFEGRKLRTHHRRGPAGVRRACTCGCTEAIQAVFEAGDELNQKEYVQEALNDMIYFVHCHVERIGEYQRFAQAVLKNIEEKRRSSPELKPFLNSLEEIARLIPQECELQKEHMKDFKYADELSKKTMALTAAKDPGNLKAYMELLKAWRDMGGAQDYVVAKCHNVTRSLAQAAGYGCAAAPAAVSFAEQIRVECRQVLRNPDGYEVWADY